MIPKFIMDDVKAKMNVKLFEYVTRPIEKVSSDTKPIYNDLTEVFKNKPISNNTIKEDSKNDPANETNTNNLDELIKLYYSMLCDKNTDSTSKWFKTNRNGLDHMILFKGQKQIKDHYIDTIKLEFKGDEEAIIFSTEDDLYNFIKYQIEFL
jgi:hypothetical protein